MGTERVASTEEQKENGISFSAKVHRAEIPEAGDFEVEQFNILGENVMGLRT